MIGAGARVFPEHLPGLTLAPGKVVALCNRSADPAQKRAEALGCPFFFDYREMLHTLKPDVAVILTPHPSHASIALDCMTAGAHVLVEKPMAIQVAEADTMLAAAEATGRKLAVVFQRRFEPALQAAKLLIDGGALGALQHVEMTAFWPRAAGYFRSASWRGTWAGEGGGVLMNQAPHQLDMLCYLLGLPTRVIAWTRTQLHHIEVETTVHALLEWPNEVHGTFHASTVEASSETERLEIRGTSGGVRIVNNVLTAEVFGVDLRDFLAETHEDFPKPVINPAYVELPPTQPTHVSVYRDLYSAIQHGTPLQSDGLSGRMSLEVANALILSGVTGQAVTLPLDRGRYAGVLQSLQQGRP